MARIRFAQNELARLSYAMSGEGDASIVLLHDTLLDRSEWNPLIDQLDDIATVVAPDARGHGASTQIADRTLTLNDLANDTYAVIDASGISTLVDVVGHGLGAITALQLLRYRPDLFASLTLIQPSAPALIRDDRARRRRIQDDLAAADLAYKQLADKALTAWANPRWGDDWRSRLPRARTAAASRHIGALAPVIDAVERWELPAFADMPSLPVTIIDTPEGHDASLIAEALAGADIVTIESMDAASPLSDPHLVDQLTAILIRQMHDRA